MDRHLCPFLRDIDIDHLNPIAKSIDYLVMPILLVAKLCL